MISFSRLYCARSETGDAVRYMPHADDGIPRPVVVLNLTRRCNLRCVHCYAHATEAGADDRMTAERWIEVIDDLGRFKSPVVLFSGGEPLIYERLPDLVRRAVGHGMRAVVSTNGVLIDRAMARTLQAAGLSYAGVSLDGLGAVHDRFRGVAGCFQRALAGIDACLSEGLKAGVRLTLTRDNVDQLPEIFDLVESHQIPRICIYHLVYSGRGSEIQSQDLDASTRRAALDLIMARTRQLHASGRPVEVLTVDNHCDGAYLYLRLLEEGRADAEQVLTMLRRSGGNSSGARIGCISWDGQVYADQFWRAEPVGNVLQKPFSEIWRADGAGQALLRQLRDRHSLLAARCQGCRFLDICNGNLRARGAVAGDRWGFDPACYLTDDEIRPGGPC